MLDILTEAPRGETTAIQFLLTQIPAPVLDALKVEWRSELYREVTEEHLDELARLVEDMRAQERRAATDTLSRYQEDVENDIAEQVARQVRTLWQAQQDDVREELADLRTALAAALARAEAAEQALLQLLEALLPRPGRRYAVARHCTVTTFPLATVNAVLRRQGHRIVGLAGASTFVIEATTAQGVRQYSALRRETHDRDEGDEPTDAAAGGEQDETAPVLKD